MSTPRAKAQIRQTVPRSPVVLAGGGREQPPQQPLTAMDREEPLAQQPVSSLLDGERNSETATEDAEPAVDDTVVEATAERGSIAPNELVHWSVGVVARWLDSTFGDPELARYVFEQQVDGAQLARLDAPLWKALGQPRRALRIKIEGRVRRVQADQQVRLRAKIGAAGRKPRSTLSTEAVTPRASSSPTDVHQEAEEPVATTPAALQSTTGTGLMDEVDGVSLGGESGKLNVFRTMLQWIPSDHRKVLTIPLHRVEQTADSPKAAGGGMFASYRIEATVSKENGSHFELLLEFAGSNAKTKRNSVLRMMQLSVVEQSEQERQWSEGRVSLPDVDVWGSTQAPTDESSAQEQAGKAEHGLPNCVDILAEMRVTDLAHSGGSGTPAYVMQCTGFNRGGEHSWPVVRKLSEFTELQSKLTALGKRQAPTSDSSELFAAFGGSTLPGVSVPATPAEWDGLARWVNSLLQSLIWNGVAVPGGADSPRSGRAAAHKDTSILQGGAGSGTGPAASDISGLLVPVAGVAGKTEPLEQVLLRVTEASEKKAEADDIQAIQRCTAAPTIDVIQTNSIIHWLAARTREEDSSIKIKTLALIKNLANDGGGALFRYSVRGMIPHNGSGAAEMQTNLEHCSLCKLPPHPVHGDKPEQMVHKHAMATLAYLRQPLSKEETQQADALIKQIVDAGDLTGGGEAALDLVRRFVSPKQEFRERGRDRREDRSLLNDATLAVQSVLPALPLGVNCEVLDVLGGGVLKDGWLWVESSTHKWARQWCVLWPATAHPQHGQFLFCFEDRRSIAPNSVLQLLEPVVRQPQKPREQFYTVLLAADCVVSVSPQQELRLSNRKHILGTMDTVGSSGATEMREWVAALRSSGPQWRHSGSTAAPDASGWLLVREKTLGMVTYTSRWCELRGSELIYYEQDGDLRSGLIDLTQFTLFTPKMPEAHKAFEFVFLSTANAGDAGLSTPSGSSKKGKRRGSISIDTDGLPFHCMCAQDEGAYSAWQAALGKVAKVATAQQSRGLAMKIGIGTGLWHTPSRPSNKTSSSSAAAKAEEPRVSQEDFEVNSLLGEGAFGRVWLVRPKEHLTIVSEPEPDLESATPGTPGTPAAVVHHGLGFSRASRSWMAMKVMAKSRVIAEQQVEHVQQERKLLQRLDHPFVVSLEYAFQSANSLFLVMEFCQGGDLYEAMHSKPIGSRHFSEPAAKFIVAELVLALEHLHESDIVYRDLKPENVLFDTEGHVRLTDFGLAKVMNRDPSILRETVRHPRVCSPFCCKDELTHGFVFSCVCRCAEHQCTCPQRP